MTRAALYIRESTEGQGDGYSPDFQRRAMVNWASQNGLEVVATYYDEVSGRTDQRPQFQEMIEAGEAGAFDELLVWHSSRFMRNRELARAYKRRLAAAGVAIRYISQGIDTSSPSGRLVEGFHELLDEHYSDQLGAWISSGYRERYQQGGLLGHVPIGYLSEVIGAQGSRALKRIVIDPHLGPLLQEGMQKYLDRELNDAQLAEWANQRGYRTRNGELFVKESWRHILRNPAYAGYVTYKRKKGQANEWVPGDHPPLWTGLRLNGVELTPLQVWEEAMRIRADRRKWGGRPPKREPYLLSQLARCARCGTRLRGDTNNPRGSWVYRYYSDPGIRGASEPCGRKRVRAESIDDQVQHLVGQLVIPPAVLAEAVSAIRQQAGRGDEATRTRARLEVRLKRLKELYTWGDLEVDEYKQHKAAIEDELRRIPEPADESLVRRAATWLQRLPELYAAAPDHLKRKLIQELFREVHVDLGEGVITAITPNRAYLPLVGRLRLETVGPAGFEPATERL